MLRVGRKVETKDISDSFYKPFEMYDPDKLDQAHFIPKLTVLSILNKGIMIPETVW